jgi:hypothetical protein
MRASGANVTASTRIARIFAGRKVGCHRVGVENFECIRPLAAKNGASPVCPQFSLAALVSTGSRTVAESYRAAPFQGWSVSLHPVRSTAKNLNPTTALPEHRPPRTTGPV